MSDLGLSTIRTQREYESVVARLALYSRPEGECVVFTVGHIQHGGHRRIGVGSRHPLVHRVAYEVATGKPIPPGLCVMHRCDNPPCIRPDHLRVGTVADNNRDKMVKGRHRPSPGSRNANAVLNEWQVAEIRAEIASGAQLTPIAKRYGVTVQLIWQIKVGRAWRHVQPADWPPTLALRPEVAAALAGAGKAGA
jgi:hypothetical protein